MYYFISDLHLGFFDREKDKKREDQFLALLDEISKDVKEIFLIGDIFDYWFEYKTVVPAPFYRTLSKISEIRDKNIPITYIMGNHDFGHKDFFEKEFGITVNRGDEIREINGKKLFISHGDGKGPGDTGYKILKKVLRAKISNWLFRIIHPDIGIGVASGSSKTSRGYTDKKDYGSNDAMTIFAEEKINEGFDYVIMGHRHKLIDQQFGSGRYINLGAWFKDPHYGVFDGENFQLKSVEQLLSR